MDKGLTQAVRTRANDRCEYCLLPQAVVRLTFQLEHVISRQHGGSDSPENLAWACGRCNRRKGPNISGIDPLSGRMTRLFDPRRDLWAEHFKWVGPMVEGLTEIGRATVALLVMNHPDDIAMRQELIECDRHPPRP